MGAGKIIMQGKNKIEIQNSSFGKETILYNGSIVSNKRSIGGTVHLFKVQEETEDVTYEVEISARWHGLSAYTTVRRNGIIIFTDK